MPRQTISNASVMAHVQTVEDDGTTHFELVHIPVEDPLSSFEPWLIEQILIQGLPEVNDSETVVV